jgi:hypothetical protein
VSRVLEASPGVVVKEFGWKYGVADISVERGGASAPGAAAPPASTPLPGAQPPAGARRQSALIEGEIRPFDGDYRKAISTINDLAARLGKDPRVAEVRVVKLPLNVNSSQALAGNTLDSPDQNTPADFRVVLVLKPNL